MAEDRAIIAYVQQLTQAAIVRADQETARALQAAFAEDAQVVAYAQQLATQTAQYARQLVVQQQARTDAQVTQAEQYAQQIGVAVLTLVLPQVAQLVQRVKTLEDSPCQQECQTLGQAK